MSTIDLETQLIEKAVEERNKIIAQAEKRVNRILENAKAEEERIRKDTEQHMNTIIGSEIRAVHDRIIGRENLEGRKKLMSIKLGLINSVFDEVENRLVKLAESDTEEYKDVLLKLIFEAAKAIGKEDIVISANKKDIKYLQTQTTKISNELGGVKILLDDEPLDIIGGVIVRNTNGTKTYYNTFKSRLLHIRKNTESKVAEIMGVV
jgi:vacuolar-type H+-ATPase subunit E/Vma4